MSAIATILHGLGHDVRGSDQKDSAALERLRGLGIAVHVGHESAQVADAEIVSRSTAIPDTNPEVIAARELGLLIHRRDEILTAITATRQTIAVAGTHGKTTTSSMLTVIFRELGLDPSFIIGGRVQGLGVGAALTEGPFLLVEADESDGTFLRLDTWAGIVTSLDPDHLDYYGSVANFEKAFAEFLGPLTGPRIVCVDDEAAVQLAARSRCTTYGTNPDADWVITNYAAHRTGSRFVIEPGNKHNIDAPPMDIALQVPGIHNARNATAAVVMAMEVAPDHPVDHIAAAIGTYSGVARRYEHRGEAAGITFVDDYAHLPSEVELTLEAAKAGDWTRVIAVFQPHRFTRTGALGATFADAFVAADQVWVTGIYTAGEKPIAGVTGRIVFDAIVAAHPEADVRYVEELPDLVAALVAELSHGDLCLTLGAGDLTALPDALIEQVALR